jgi:hypothetical protein
MPNPNTQFQTNINKKNLNIMWIVLLVIAFAGSFYLAVKNIQAGVIYSLMFLGVTVLILLLFFFLKDDNSLKPITEYIKIPIETMSQLPMGVFMYLFGLAFPFLTKGFLMLIGFFAKIPSLISFDVSSLSIPLFGASIDKSFQSFSTSEIGQSMAWKIFVKMFTAGTDETWTYNFGLMLLGILIGWFVLVLINDGKDLRIMSKKTFVLIFAFGLTMILFMLSHLLNNTYAGAMFIVAGVFLLVANISIYLKGVFLLFWCGWHQSNNLLALINDYGLGQVAEGFVSWFGLLFFVFLALLIFYLIRKNGEVWRELKTWINS